jgi:23S rRNA-/tRNA-specific pseudouridylate synthase
MGPYEVEIIFENGSVKIKIIYEEKVSFVVNKNRLILYHKPMTKGKFVHDILQQFEMEVFNRDSPPPSSTFT